MLSFIFLICCCSIASVIYFSLFFVHSLTWFTPLTFLFACWILTTTLYLRLHILLRLQLFVYFFLLFSPAIFFFGYCCLLTLLFSSFPFPLANVLILYFFLLLFGYVYFFFSSTRFGLHLLIYFLLPFSSALFWLLL